MRNKSSMTENQNVMNNAEMKNKKDWTRQNKYNREKYKQTQIRLRKETYPHLLNWVELVPSFNVYIRGLMQKDMLERQERGEIEIDPETGEIRVTGETEGIELKADGCSKWNLTGELPGDAEDIWSIDLKAKKDKNS